MKKLLVYSLLLIIVTLFFLQPTTYNLQPVYAVDLGDKYAFGSIISAAGFINRNLTPSVFEIAGLAMLFYTVIAAVKYMTSGGDKEAVASARNMITHSVIGFLLLIFMFLLLQYLLPAIGLENFKIF